MSSITSCLPNEHRGTAKAWARRAAELAAWTWSRCLNRVDAWGAYTPIERRGQSYTRRGDNTQAKVPTNYTAKGTLTRYRIERHFRAQGAPDVLGLHAISPGNTSLWGALDLDHHGDGGNKPEANLQAALSWYARLVHMGFRPVLTDSNGRGGFHLRTLFQPIRQTRHWRPARYFSRAP